MSGTAHERPGRRVVLWEMYFSSKPRAEREGIGCDLNSRREHPGKAVTNAEGGGNAMCQTVVLHLGFSDLLQRR